MTTDREDRRLLAVHGTRPIRLSPGAILATAKKDIERRSRNKTVAANDLAGGPYERYAFFSDHVRGAKTAGDVLRKALKAAESPAFADRLKRRGDPNAFYLCDPDTLRAALGVADVVEPRVA